MWSRSCSFVSPKNLRPKEKKITGPEHRIRNTITALTNTFMLAPMVNARLHAARPGNFNGRHRCLMLKDDKAGYKEA
jgi:hypothetical protein